MPIARRAPPMRSHGEKTWQSARRFFFRSREDFWKRPWKSCRWHRVSFSCERIGRKMIVGTAAVSRRQRTAENAEDAEDAEIVVAYHALDHNI
jgi:hypothetical protein